MNETLIKKIRISFFYWILIFSIILIIPHPINAHCETCGTREKQKQKEIKKTSLTEIKKTQKKKSKCTKECNTYNKEVNKELKLTEKQTKSLIKLKKEHQLIPILKKDLSDLNNQLSTLLTKEEFSKEDQHNASMLLVVNNAHQKQLTTKKLLFISQLNSILPIEKTEKYLLLQDRKLDCKSCELY